MFKEYGYLIAIIVAIFSITLLGAIYSPTFEEQKSFLELFFMMGSLLFIFSALVLFATLGFASFALYAAVFLAAVMGMYGVEGAALVVLLTYLAWGGIFGMQFLLLAYGTKSALEWFENRYTYRNFRYEYTAFYPMIWIDYLLLEALPSLFLRERPLHLKPKRVLEGMKTLLPPR